MQIDELSANIDQKLTVLEQELAALKQRSANSQDAAEKEQIAHDLLALGKIKTKLLKSRQIAWRAHQLLMEQEDHRVNDRNRTLGLILCILSGVLAVVLISIYFWSGAF